MVHARAVQLSRFVSRFSPFGCWVSVLVFHVSVFGFCAPRFGFGFSCFKFYRPRSRARGGRTARSRLRCTNRYDFVRKHGLKIHLKIWRPRKETVNYVQTAQNPGIQNSRLGLGGLASAFGDYGCVTRIRAFRFRVRFEVLRCEVS